MYHSGSACSRKGSSPPIGWGSNAGHTKIVTHVHYVHRFNNPEFSAGLGLPLLFSVRLSQLPCTLHRADTPRQSARLFLSSSACKRPQSCRDAPSRVFSVPGPGPGRLHQYLMKSSVSPWKLASQKVTKKGSRGSENSSSPSNVFIAGFRASASRKLRTSVGMRVDMCLSLGRESIVHSIFSEEWKTPKEPVIQTASVYA